MLLKNERGKNGKITDGVIIPYNIFNRFCNIEQNYNSKETYPIVQSGELRTRQLYRTTNSDIQCFTILHKVCHPQTGMIRNVKKHSIYHKLQEYYEKPIVASEFYASLEKLLYHGIIREEYDPSSDLYTFYIVDYYNETTKKTDFLAVISPVVFTAAFYQLSVGQKKLFYSLSIQQGGKNRPLHRSIKGVGKADIQYRLKDFLHRKDNYHIKKLADDLLSACYGDTPFLQHVSFEKKGKKYVQATFVVHPSWISKVQKKEYHDFIEPTLVYQKKTRFIERLLNQAGLGELVSQDHQLELIRLVRFFRNKGYRMIRHAINKLKEFVHNTQTFPTHILAFVKSVCRSEIEANIMDLARKYHVKDWIGAGATDPIEREDHEFSFLSAMSRFTLQQIKKAFQNALGSLRTKYATVHSNISLEDYTGVQALENIKGIWAVRQAAYRANTNIEAYRELERSYQTDLVDCVVRGERVQPILHNMLKDIESLPVSTYYVDVPSSFRLEDFLMQNGYFTRMS